MTRKIRVEVWDEDCEDERPFLKWVTEIVNATPAEHLESLMMRGRGCDWPRVEISYERDLTREEAEAEQRREADRAALYQRDTIEREKRTLRAMKAKYPND